MRGRNSWWVGFLVSGLVLAILFLKIEWTDFRASLAAFSPPVLAVAAGIYLLGFIPRACRWSLMMKPVAPLSPAVALRLIFIGYGANNLLPFRLGELVRAVAAKRATGAPFSAALASVFAERILDGAVIVLLLLAATGLLLGQVPAEITWLLGLGGAGFGLTLAALWWAAGRETWLERLKSAVPDSFAGVLDQAWGALRFFRSSRVFPAAGALSLAVWLIEGAMFGWLLRVMEVPHPWIAGYFCLAVINLGILLPSSPGYVGVFQGAAVAAFLALGQTGADGFAFGLVIHAVQFVPVTILGVVFFFQTGLTPRVLRESVPTGRRE